MFKIQDSQLKERRNHAVDYEQKGGVLGRTTPSKKRVAKIAKN
jgi:hypothetical protein